MAKIVQSRRVWTRQPQGPVEIDRSNPLSNGLEIAAVMSSPAGAYNAVTGEFSPLLTSTRYQSSSGNYGMMHTALSPGQQAVVRFPTTIRPDRPLTVFQTFKLSGNPTGAFSRRLWDAGMGETVDRLYMDGPDYSSFRRYYIYCSANYTGIADTAGTSDRIDSNRDWSYVFASSPGQAGSILDSKGRLTLSTAGTAVYTDPPNRNFTLYSFGTDIVRLGLTLVWSKRLTENEQAAILQNPWQIFRPQRRVAYFDMGAGGAVSLSVADVSHAHGADNLALSTASLLSVADALHAHSADNLTLSVTGTANLVIADALHSHTSDNIGLTSSTGIAVADSLHGHTADNVTLGLAGVANLLIADATHSHSADNIALTSAHRLTVSDATHAHAADALTLSTSVALAVQDSSHAHAADSLTLDASNATVLNIADGLHSHSADSIVISSDVYLSVLDAIHSHYADNVGLGIPVLPTIGRPVSDATNSGWTASTGSDLFAMLDEVTPDDADYISTTSVGASCSFGLNGTSFPGGATQQLRLRASSPTGNGLTVVIKDGATTIATRSLVLSSSFELHTITLTAGEISAITSGNLTVEMIST